MDARIYIRDDNRFAWFYEDGRIRCLEAEKEAADENGYECASFEDGVRFLNEHGYINVTIGEEDR